MGKENRFYTALEEIFVGAKIEGDSGYINLLKIKEQYYSKVLNKFKDDVNESEVIVGDFKEEFFDRLFTFFDRYFSESGSVYFTKTANWQNVYEKVYTDNDDVVLFWKTHMLYYVKSDILFKDIEVKINDEEKRENYNFFFDVGKLESKQNNEKREIIYEFNETKMNNKNETVYIFDVMYSTHGKKTKVDDIVKDTEIPDYILEKAFKTFEKQSEVDFFINKNAKLFLEEQLNLYLHQILLDDANQFEKKRLDQIKELKKFSQKIIYFISQFEDELVRIWNKPKFVLNSDYVISLKSLKSIVSTNDYEEFLESVKNNINENKKYREDLVETIKQVYKQPLQRIYVNEVDIKENIKIKYVKSFKTNDARKKYFNTNPDENKVDLEVYDKGTLIEGKNATYSGGNLAREIDFDSLYIDTKFFSEEVKSKILEKISDKHNIDELIDGYLVQSDNYQYLNSVNKFNNKISMVYIDPPFNTEGSSYAYLDKFKDSTWLSMLSDRLKLTENKYLSEGGAFYIHLDHHCNYLGRSLTENIFKDKFNREIIWNTSPSLSGLKTAANNFIRQHDMILFYSNNKANFNKMYVNYKNVEVEDLGWLDIFRDDDDKLYVYKYKDNDTTLSKYYLEEFPSMAIGDVWNDVYSMMYTQNMTRENWGIDNTQKPENLLRRIIQASTSQEEWVLDYYTGTGTTVAAAHKLNRKWIGVEAGDFFEETLLKRMKSVVFGDIRPKLSIDLNWQGGGIFKYYQLEQYEDTLKNSVYKTGQLDLFDSKNPFEEYIFYADNKLADVLEVEKDNMEFNFEKLYINIDWPETFSNLLGLPIKKIYKDYFVLGEGETDIKINTDFNKMTKEQKTEFIKMAKPLLWWGE